MTPRIGTAALIRHGRSILLGRRDKDPQRGKWVAPGGGIQWGESFRQAMERELREETGLQYDLQYQTPHSVREIINPPDEHRIIVLWRLTLDEWNGTPVAGGDLSEVRFFAPPELRLLAVEEQLTPFMVATLQECGWL